MRKLGIFILIGLFLCFSFLVVATLFLARRSQISAQNLPIKQRWIYEADSRIRATPIVYEDRILVRTSNTLHVVDALSGALLWTFSLPDDKHADPPLVQNDIVILTHARGTSALQLETGEIIWEVRDDDSRSDALPVAANKDIVIVSDDSVLVRDLNTGELLWSLDHPYPRSNAFVGLDDESLYVVFRDQTHNYDIETGELRWKESTDEWVIRNGLAGLLENNILYLERKGGGMSAYNVDERRTLWNRTDLSLGYYPITKHDDILLVGTRGQAPAAINASTGEILWKADIWSLDDYQTPLLMNDVIYVRALFAKKIYVLSLESGEVVGSIDLGIPDIVSLNADYSLGPVRYNDLIIFPVGEKLLAYGK